jgi:pentose-5-phosphate-3-epimerase
MSKIASAYQKDYDYIVVINVDPEFTGVINNDEYYNKIAEISFKDIKDKLRINARLDDKSANSVAIWSSAKDDDIVIVYGKNTEIFDSNCGSFELLYEKMLVFENIAW